VEAMPWAVKRSGQFVPYPPTISTHIEACHKRGDAEAHVSIEGRFYIVVLTQPLHQCLASDRVRRREVRFIIDCCDDEAAVASPDDKSLGSDGSVTAAPDNKVVASAICARWRLEVSDGEGLDINDDQLLSSGFTIGRDMFYGYGSETRKFISMKQAVLHEGSDGTHLVCESTGRNPIGIKAAGSSSWTRLDSGEKAQLRPGDELAPSFHRSPKTSPYVLRQIHAAAGSDDVHVAAEQEMPDVVAGGPSQLGKRKVDDSSSVPMLSQLPPHEVEGWFESFRFDAAANAGERASSSSGSPSAAKAPRHRSNKDEQAWLYPDFKTQRATSIYINGSKYVDPKELPEEQPRKLRESNFKLTINPNKVVPDDLREVADAAWEGGLNCIKSGLWNGSCIKFGPTDPANFGSDHAKDVVVDVVLHAKTEVGEKLNRLHAHPIVKVKHYSQLHLSTQGIMKAFKDGYNRALESSIDGDICVLTAARIRHTLKMEGKPYVTINLMHSDNYNEVMTRYAFKDNQDACPK